MATTKATIKDLARQIQNKSARARIKVLLDALCDAYDAMVVGSAGFLTADTAGRAVMATGYFIAATVLDKFGVGSIDATAATSIIAANAIDESKLARRVAAQALSGAGAINTTAITTLFTSTDAAQALTLADGSFAGQRKRIIHIADGGSGVITQTTGAKLTASITTITFTNIWDWVELEWSGSLWNVVGRYGVTIA